MGLIESLRYKRIGLHIAWLYRHAKWTLDDLCSDLHYKHVCVYMCIHTYIDYTYVSFRILRDSEMLDLFRVLQTTEVAPLIQSRVLNPGDLEAKKTA